MPDLPWRLATFDIDGTLTLGHGWAPIADAFGRRRDFDRTNRAFFARSIGEDEHLANLLDLATGRTVAEVEAVLARTPVLAGIRDGVARLRSAGPRPVLLSHNPTYVLDWYRRTFGFEDGEGVSVAVGPDGRIRPPSGIRAGKAAGLTALLARSNGATSRTTVHVGDGWADAAVFLLVGGGIAVNSRLPEVARAADVALTTRDFADVVGAIERLRPRP